MSQFRNFVEVEEFLLSLQETLWVGSKPFLYCDVTLQPTKNRSIDLCFKRRFSAIFCLERPVDSQYIEYLSHFLHPNLNNIIVVKVDKRSRINNNILYTFPVRHKKYHGLILKHCV